MGDWFIAGNMLSLQGFSHFGANFPMNEGQKKKVCVCVCLFGNKTHRKKCNPEIFTQHKVHEKLTKAKLFYLASQAFSAILQIGFQNFFFLQCSKV